MAKKGHRKPVLELVKKARGTQRRDRQTVVKVPPLDGAPVKPKWLKPAASKIWDEKVAVYLERRQSVRGSEGPLAQYCSLEADLIQQWRRGTPPMPSELAQYRILANEFYDTPASQASIKPKGAEGNRFARNGAAPGGTASAGRA